MPYISQQMRFEIDSGKYDVPGPGALNFKITTLCDDYLSENGINYSNINEVIGVLECAKLELYRRIASPYEDKNSTKMVMFITPRTNYKRN